MLLQALVEQQGAFQRQGHANDGFQQVVGEVGPLGDLALEDGEQVGAALSAHQLDERAAIAVQPGGGVAASLADDQGPLGFGHLSVDLFEEVVAGEEHRRRTGRRPTDGRQVGGVAGVVVDALRIGAQGVGAVDPAPVARWERRGVFANQGVRDGEAEQEGLVRQLLAVVGGGGEASRHAQRGGDSPMPGLHLARRIDQPGHAARPVARWRGMQHHFGIGSQEEPQQTSGRRCPVQRVQGQGDRPLAAGQRQELRRGQSPIRR